MEMVSILLVASAASAVVFFQAFARLRKAHENGLEERSAGRFWLGVIGVLILWAVHAIIIISSAMIITGRL